MKGMKGFWVEGLMIQDERLRRDYRLRRSSGLKVLGAGQFADKLVSFWKIRFWALGAV
jgi:hypothetical protein